MGVGKIESVVRRLLAESGSGSGGIDPTRANMLVDASSGAWGSWGLNTDAAMQSSGHGTITHQDSTSAIVYGAAYGSRFCQRSASAAWQTVGTDYYAYGLFQANTGLQFVHELDCIPFDDETSPSLANMYIFMWGLWSQRSTALIGVGGNDPVDAHGCGVRFKVGTDTNFMFCADNGSGSLTLVDSGLAPADGVRYVFRAKYNGLVESSGSCVLEILNGDKVVLATNTFTANGPGGNEPIDPRIFWQGNGTSIVRSLSIISQEWAMGLPD